MLAWVWSVLLIDALLESIEFVEPVSTFTHQNVVERSPGTTEVTGSVAVDGIWQNCQAKAMKENIDGNDHDRDGGG